MRRKDKIVEDIEAMETIIRGAKICRLGLCENEQPYIVPLCFGYEDKNLYFHCATEGKKLDILKSNNNVCFEMDIDPGLMEADEACNWGFTYKSIIGFGRALIVNDVEMKCRALDLIMKHYTQGSFTYSAESLDNIVIIRVEIEEMTGKRSG